MSSSFVDFKAFVNARRKTIAAAAASIVTWVGIVVASPSGPITSTEWHILLADLAVATGVYVTRNR